MGRPSKNEVIRLRIKTIRLHNDGISNYQIAKQVGVSDSVVNKWIKTFESGGLTALMKPDARGGKSKLTEEQLTQLVLMVKAGAKTQGHKTNRWSINMVQALILKEFDVDYSEKNINKLLGKRDVHIPDSRRSYIVLNSVLATVKKQLPSDYGFPTEKWTAAQVQILAKKYLEEDFELYEIKRYFNKKGFYFRNQQQTKK